MKKIATSLLLLTGSFIGFSQNITDVSGGPDTYGYSWISSDSKPDTTLCIECGTFTGQIDTFSCADGNCVADLMFVDTIFYSATGSAAGGDTLYAADSVYADTISSITGVDGPEFNWIDISTIGTVIGEGLADDNTAGPFSIGFDMPYYWYTSNTFYIGSNGYIMFDKATTISSNPTGDAFPAFPNDADGHDNFIAPLMGDLNFSQDPGAQINPAKVYQYSNGTDTLIVTFENVAFWTDNNDGWSGANTFQVVLSKSAKTITLNYLSQNGVWNSGYDQGATQIGMESVGAISGLQIASAVYPQDSLSIVISLDADPSFSVSDVRVPTTKGQFISGRYETNFTTEVQNIGTEDATSAFDVDMKLSLSQSGSNAKYRATESVSSLAAGATQSLEASNAFNPSDPATFTSPTQVVEQGKSYYLVTESKFADDASINDENTSEVRILADTLMQSVDMSYAEFNGNSAAAFGFEGGGVYIKPPYYPIDIVSLNYYFMTADDAPTGDFFARLWADNGTEGTFDLKVDETVISSRIIPNIFDANGLTEENGMTQIFLDAPVTITEGGFYVGFQYVDIDAASYNIAESNLGSAPKSFHNYEILSGVFGEYRSNADADLMIGVTVDALAAKTSVEEIINNLEIGEVYPNPASDVASLKVDVKSASKVSYSVRNIIGQQVIAENIGNVNAGQKVINFNVSNLDAGIYFCTVTINGNSTTKKFTVK